LTLTHDAFVWLGHAPHSVFKLTIMIWHPFDDDVSASRDVLVTGGFEINGLTDLKFVGRHDCTIDTPTSWACGARSISGSSRGPFALV
jgi:hypothetical protein